MTQTKSPVWVIFFLHFFIAKQNENSSHEQHIFIYINSHCALNKTAKKKVKEPAHIKLFTSFLVNSIPYFVEYQVTKLFLTILFDILISPLVVCPLASLVRTIKEKKNYWQHLKIDRWLQSEWEGKTFKFYFMTNKNCGNSKEISTLFLADLYK